MPQGWRLISLSTVWTCLCSAEEGSRPCPQSRTWVSLVESPSFGDEGGGSLLMPSMRSVDPPKRISRLWCGMSRSRKGGSSQRIAVF